MRVQPHRISLGFSREATQEEASEGPGGVHWGRDGSNETLSSSKGAGDAMEKGDRLPIAGMEGVLELGEGSLNWEQRTHGSFTHNQGDGRERERSLQLPTQVGVANSKWEMQTQSIQRMLKESGPASEPGSLLFEHATGHRGHSQDLREKHFRPGSAGGACYFYFSVLRSPSCQFSTAC